MYKITNPEILKKFPIRSPHSFIIMIPSPFDSGSYCIDMLVDVNDNYVFKTGLKHDIYFNGSIPNAIRDTTIYTDIEESAKVLKKYGDKEVDYFLEDFSQILDGIEKINEKKK